MDAQLTTALLEHSRCRHSTDVGRVKRVVFKLALLWHAIRDLKCEQPTKEAFLSFRDYTA